MNSPVLDVNGFLRGIPYHDGQIQGLVISEGRVSLGLCSVDGDCHVLELGGISALRVDGLREGNIVLAIRILSAGSLSLDDELSDLVREKLGLDLSVVPNGDELVARLETSFGAEVLAVCTEWSVARGSLVVSRPAELR